jgi:hypothetical protein
VKRAILKAEPPPDIRVAIAWIHMLSLDNAVTARCMAAAFRDPRVQHFHDPRRRAGAAVAASLGAPGKMAWDVYLFYPAGPGWEGGPPQPATWAHQLTGSNWADPVHYYRGPDLVQQLRMAIAKSC